MSTRPNLIEKPLDHLPERDEDMG